MRWPPPISPRRLLLVALCSIPGTFSLRLVTLDTIDIFTTHEWFPRKPTVYFRCIEENKTYLPDVKEANLIYTFKGEESWQPLTELPEKKCKRCGLYEEDTYKRDDVFDEWELCSSDFKDGKYTRIKEGQFNVTFLCPNCTAPSDNSLQHNIKEGQFNVTFLCPNCTAPSVPLLSYPMALGLTLPIASLFVAGRQTAIQQPPPVLPMTCPACRSRSRSMRRRPMRGGGVVAMADLLGDLGARDPFPEEIESNFAEKVLGDVDTLHRILIPTLSVLSLARLPIDPNPSRLAIDDARKLLLKVVGWRLDADEEGMRLQCLWKVRDEACGQELIRRITAVLDGAGHAPTTLLLEPPNQVKAELHSPSVGGLSMNDFIIAARIDKVKTLDLIPKKRVWA